MTEKIVLYMDPIEDEINAALDFLIGIGIESCEISYNSDDSLYELSIDEKDFDIGKDALSDFLATELEQTDDVAQNDTHAKAYVDSKVKYEDVSSSAYTLLGFGIIGIIYLVLEITGVINILPMIGSMKILFYIVMGTLFIVFLIAGLISFISLKKLKEEINTETTITSDVNKWADDNFDATSVDSNLFSENADELDPSEKYFARYNYIKELLSKQFPNINPSLAEELIENIYSKTFES